MTTFESENPRSGLIKTIAVLSAIILTAAVVVGYFYMRWRHAQQNQPQNQAVTQETKPYIAPKVTIFIDEAMIKGSNVVIGGTVKNISQENLSGLSIELELFKRKTNESEKRVLPLEPKDIAPGQTARYTITIPSKEFAKTKISRLFSNTNNSNIAFNTDEGAKRPPQYPTQSKTKIIIEKPKSGAGDGFYNSPDDPVIIK